MPFVQEPLNGNSALQTLAESKTVDLKKHSANGFDQTKLKQTQLDPFEKKRNRLLHNWDHLRDATNDILADLRLDIIQVETSRYNQSARMYNASLSEADLETMSLAPLRHFRTGEWIDNYPENVADIAEFSNQPSHAFAFLKALGSEHLFDARNPGDNDFGKPEPEDLPVHGALFGSGVVDRLKNPDEIGATGLKDLKIAQLGDWYPDFPGQRNQTPPSRDRLLRHLRVAVGLTPTPTVTVQPPSEGEWKNITFYVPAKFRVVPDAPSQDSTKPTVNANGVDSTGYSKNNGVKDADGAKSGEDQGNGLE